MIIDDDPDDRYLIEYGLKKTGVPIEVLSFADAEDALEFFERVARSSFPLPETLIVFCDVSMPRMNGFEVIERIRAQPKFDGARVYVLTTSTRPTDQEQAKAVGADGYLVKFPSTDIFAEVLEAV